MVDVVERDTPLLEFENVSYSYEDQPYALREISLAVHAGERIAVLGSNGAGKSTFFLHCNGVLTPDEGVLRFCGQPVAGGRRQLLELRQQVGIVFQDPNQQLIGSTVAAEVSFGPMNLRLAPEEVRHRVDTALAELNLTALRERPPHLCSGGEKKRVGIAGVLAMHPAVLLLDEPTASLDCANAQLLEQILQQLSARGKTLLVATHDVDFVWRWAGRVLVFAGGRLLADGPVQEVFANPHLLAQAGLRRPLLCDVAEMLRQQGLFSAEQGAPRSVAELRQQLAARCLETDTGSA